MAATISSLIASAESGDPSAADALFTALYSELHRLAARQLGRGRSNLTLGTTTLLHEAYLNVSRRSPSFPDRARFMAYCARVMRRLVIDYARRRQAQKRGGGFELTALVQEPPAAPPPDPAELEELSAALDDLAAADPPLAELVDLKFFGGFSLPEIAAMRGVTARTVQRQWEKARLYLQDAIRRSISA